MKAVIYCRVSSEEQVSNMSLGTQERACREHCARSGWEVDRVFVERGESAKTADRPELQAAIDHCQKSRRSVGVFLVYALDRFARQAEDHHVLRGVLARLQIAVRSVTQGMVGDDSPESRLIETQFAGMAQYDNECRARNTRRGMRAALESGRWCWQPPIGYRTQHDPTTGRHLGIELNPDTAPLIARAFRAIAFGARVADVAADLQGAGVLGARGRSLAEQTLHRALRNPLYKGRLVVPRRGIDREATHPALVDAATWARAQHQLDPRVVAGEPRAARPYRRGNPEFPLGGGFARCAPCSKPLTGAWARGKRQRYPYYRCHGCGAVNVRGEQLEQGFVDLLRALQPTPGRWATFRGLVSEQYRLAAGDHAERAARARKQLAAIEAKRERLIDAYVYERALEEGDYRARIDRLKRQEIELQLDIARCEETTLGLEDLLDFVGATLARPADLWLESDARQRRELGVRICPAGITYDGGEIRTPATISLFSALGTDANLIPREVPPTGSDANTGWVDFSLLIQECVEYRGAYGAP